MGLRCFCVFFFILHPQLHRSFATDVAAIAMKFSVSNVLLLFKVLENISEVTIGEWFVQRNGPVQHSDEVIFFF